MDLALILCPAAADTGLSYAYGPGLEDGLRDTEPGEFKIQAVNKNGEPMKQGGDDFTVRVRAEWCCVPVHF